MEMVTGLDAAIPILGAGDHDGIFSPRFGAADACKEFGQRPALDLFKQLGQIVRDGRFAVAVDGKRILKQCLYTVRAFVKDQGMR